MSLKNDIKRHKDNLVLQGIGLYTFLTEELSKKKLVPTDANYMEQLKAKKIITESLDRYKLALEALNGKGYFQRLVSPKYDLMFYHKAPANMLEQFCPELSSDQATQNSFRTWEEQLQKANNEVDKLYHQDKVERNMVKNLLRCLLVLTLAACVFSFFITFGPIAAVSALGLSAVLLSSLYITWHAVSPESKVYLLQNPIDETLEQSDFDAAISSCGIFALTSDEISLLDPKTADPSSTHDENNEPSSSL